MAKKPFRFSWQAFNASSAAEWRDKARRAEALGYSTFHIADPECLVSAGEIRHRPVGAKAEVSTTPWLPPAGPVTIGLTSGASTPDNLMGAVVARLAGFAGPAA